MSDDLGLGLSKMGISYERFALRGTEALKLRRDGREANSGGIVSDHISTREDVLDRRGLEQVEHKISGSKQSNGKNDVRGMPGGTG